PGADPDRPPGRVGGLWPGRGGAGVRHRASIRPFLWGHPGLAGFPGDRPGAGDRLWRKRHPLGGPADPLVGGEALMLSEEEIRPRVRAMQVIMSALLTGLAAFAGVVVFLGTQREGQPKPEVPLLTYISLGALALAGTASFLLPELLRGMVIRMSLAQGG